jgi:regulator of cell morphogenesis and NO signaling
MRAQTEALISAVGMARDSQQPVRSKDTHMASIRTRLQDIARKARARLPLHQHVRDLLRRVAPGSPPEASVPTPPSEAAPEPVVVKVKQPNWEQRTQAELVDHIVGHFHARLRVDLPALIDAARRIEREHATHPAVPAQLADELATLHSELEGHMHKEETVLFPMLRSGARGGQLSMPIRMMERDHEGHDAGLERIRQRTGGLEAPADASPAWIELYAALERLESELHQHIYLENNILFARASGPHED